MLDDPGVGDAAFCVIDHCIALEIVRVRHFLGLKMKGPVLEGAVALPEEFIDHSGVEDLVKGVLSHRKHCPFPVGSRDLADSKAEIRIEDHRDALQHFFNHRGISADRDSLVPVIKIVVVVDKPDREPADDKGGQLRAVPAPLLLRVALDKLFIDIASDERQSLLFEVRRFADLGFPDLPGDHVLRLLRSADPPHFAEGIHIKRQVVDLISVSGDGTVDILIEFRELLDILPDFLVGSVEDMRSVAVHMDTVSFFCINIAGDVAASVDHSARYTFILHFPCKNGAEKSRAYNKPAIMHLLSLSLQYSQNGAVSQGLPNESVRPCIHFDLAVIIHDLKYFFPSRPVKPVVSLHYSFRGNLGGQSFSRVERGKIHRVERKRFTDPDHGAVSHSLYSSLKGGNQCAVGNIHLHSKLPHTLIL